MTTIFVGIAAVIITQRQIKLREIEEAHREKKVEIYQKFMGTVTSLIAGQNEQVTIKAPTEQELIDYLVGFKTEILLWGSPKVIKSQLEFEKVSGSGGDVFMAVNNLYSKRQRTSPIYPISEQCLLHIPGKQGFDLF